MAHRWRGEHVERRHPVPPFEDSISLCLVGNLVYFMLFWVLGARDGIIKRRMFGDARARTVR